MLRNVTVHCQQVRLGFVQGYQDDSITDDASKFGRAIFRDKKSIMT